MKGAKFRELLGYTYNLCNGVHYGVQKRGIIYIYIPISIYIMYVYTCIYINLCVLIIVDLFFFFQINWLFKI